MTDRLQIIVDAAAAIAAKLGAHSGSIFYSGRAAFEQPSDIYVLGLNPGGSPEMQAAETIQRDFDDWQTLPTLWSRYVDESWLGKKPGTHGMQPRIRHMFDQLGVDLRSTPASNAIFVRSRSAADLGDDASALFSRCWQFHETVIRTLGVKTILCLGTASGNWTRKALGADRPINQFQERNKRRWSSRAHISSDGIAVVTLTHPSIANWRNSSADPSPMVREVLSRE